MNDNKKTMQRKLQDINFAVLETVLYLDGHPNNKKALDYYKKVKGMRDVIYSEYVQNYGPVYSEDVRQDYWSWINDPWPWQNHKEG